MKHTVHEIYALQQQIHQIRIVHYKVPKKKDWVKAN